MPVRNYGPRGCLIVAGVLAAAVVILYVVFHGIDVGGPGPERVQAQTVKLVEKRLTDKPFSDVTVTSVHPRRARYRLAVDHWTVQGKLTYSGVAETFIAIVRTRCDDYDNLVCWKLDKLSVADEVYRD